MQIKKKIMCDVIMTSPTLMTLTAGWRSIVQSLMFVPPVVAEELNRQTPRIALYILGVTDFLQLPNIKQILQGCKVNFGQEAARSLIF